MDKQETRQCASSGCKSAGIYVFTANALYYCRDHYKQIMRTSANKDQTTFVLASMDVDLSYGAHANAKLNYRLGKRNNTYWLSTSHVADIVNDDGDPDERRKTLSLQNIHPEDLRSIAHGLNELANEIESHIDRMRG